MLILISKRIFRGTPTETIFSYLPEILRKIGAEVTSKEHRIINDRFEGLVEGLKAENPSVLIRIQIRGGEEPWNHIGGRFVSTIYTSHVTTETYETTREGHKDSRDSLELLQLFDTKISMYVWHTAG